MIGGNSTLHIPIPPKQTIEREAYVQAFRERLRPTMPKKTIPKPSKIGFSSPYLGTSLGAIQPKMAKEIGGSMPMTLLVKSDIGKLPLI